MRRFWVFYALLPMLLFVMLCLGSFASATVAAPGQIPQDKLVRFEISPQAPDPNETFELVNQQRLIAGLSPLIANEKLGNLARARATDMVERQYYAHKNPDAKFYFDYFDKFGIRTGYNCENLDLVFVPDQNKVISEWMSSLRGHRACLMNQQTTHAGYSSAKLTIINADGGETTAYVVVAIHAALHDL